MARRTGIAPSSCDNSGAAAGVAPPPATGRRPLDYQSAFAEVNSGGVSNGGGGGSGSPGSKENAPASVLRAAANASIKRGWDKAAKGKANHLAYAEVNAPAGAVFKSARERW